MDLSPTGLGHWLTAPSVIPWIGAILAALAALAVTGRAWFKDLRFLPVRLLGVAAVWLLGIGLLAALLPKPEPVPSPSPPSQQAPPPSTESAQVVIVTGGQLPSGLSSNTILAIHFLPSEGDARVARDFACDLLLLGGTAPENIEVRGQNMAEFEKLLVQQLRRVTVPADFKEPGAVIFRVPFPGEGVLRRVREKVQHVLPEVVVSTEGGP
jgi:uncharacterized SAM-binding protein YcdF (DUF218 family)